MVGQEDEVTPKTLADPVPPVCETLSATDGGGVNGVRVSDVSVEGFDINAPLDENGATAVVVQSEATTVDTIIRLGPGGLDNGLVEPEGDGVFIGADVKGPLVGTPKGDETDNGVVDVVEPEGDEVFLGADVQGATPKDVETDNGDGVNASAFDTSTDCDAGNHRMENLHGDSDVQGPLVGIPRDVETGNGDEEVNASAFDTSTDGDAGSPRIENSHGDSDSDVEMDRVTEERVYSVGELVWGKIKSHPWWPGQIYDPSDACSVAMNLDSKGRLLVAFFGDGTFAWCLPSQLIPFAEHFDEMSKQSGPKNFMIALTEAADEIVRLVDLEMTCTCVPEKNRKGLERALVVNAGIKPGVIAPEGDIDKLLSFRYDPSELLATMAITAKTLSFTNLLKLSILKGWLSSFYRARGGYSLPLYHEPVLIEGLEDQSETDSMVNANAIVVFNKVPLKGPVEEECGSMAITDSENGRKQKSVAELMAAGTNTTPRNRKCVSARVEGRVLSDSANKKRKANMEDGSCNSIAKSCPAQRRRGRKDMDEVSGYKISKACKTGGTLKLLKVDIPRESNEEGGDLKCSEGMFSPRERKKSKYLSFPYTSPRSRVGYPSYKDEERESEKITGITRVGERMTKAAVQIRDSTPLNYNGKMEKKQVPIVYSREKAVKSADKKNSILLDGNAVVEEVLSGLNSVAADPLISLTSNRVEVTREFISAFRSSIYLNGSKRKENTVNESNQNEIDLRGDQARDKTQNGIDLPGDQGKKRGRNSNVFENSDVKRSNQNGIDLSGDNVRGKKRGRNSNVLEKSDAKRPARYSTKKGNFEGVEQEVGPLASSLVLNFAPAFPLPSKVEIIKTFSKFGNINENETDVLSGNVKIVYMNSGCAEAALRVSLSEKPFGSAIVDYSLCYSSMLEGVPDGSAVSGSVSEDTPQLDSIRQHQW